LGPDEVLVEIHCALPSQLKDGSQKLPYGGTTIELGPEKTPLKSAAVKGDAESGAIGGPAVNCQTGSGVLRA
jgi:hypothetical protein